MQTSGLRLGFPLVITQNRMTVKAMRITPIVGQGQSCIGYIYFHTIAHQSTKNGTYCAFKSWGHPELDSGSKSTLEVRAQGMEKDPELNSG